MRRVHWLSASLLAALAVASPATADDVVAPPEVQQLEAISVPLAADAVPNSILVRFSSKLTQTSRTQLRQLVGGTLEKEFTLVPGLEHIKTDIDAKAAIDKLRVFSGLVLYAEPDYIVHRCVTPNDTNFALLWGMNSTGQTVNGDPGIANADINAPEAWDTTTGSSTTVIADIDTGVNYNHPDLAANSWINPGEIAGNGIDDDANGYIDDTRGWDFANNDNNPIDDNGHGTHTAGTFGAVGNNGVGVTGVNWQCKIMALKFLNSAGSGSTSGALGALNYAVNKGVKVSNNSWGGGGFSQAMLDAINAAAAQNHVFVAAAGNGGADQIGDNNDSIPSYPASYNAANVISVASTTNNDTRSSFSNYGAASVDLGAPGSTILSTYNSGYAYLNGTSMATPHVTGVVALVQTLNPTWTHSQVKQRILSTVRPISALAGITVSGGVVNAAAAVGVVEPPTNTAPTVSISSPGTGLTFSTGASITFTGSAVDTQDGSLTASLAWSSSIQGALGSGGTFSRSDLLVGTHVITASVTDSGSLSGSASVTISVVDPAAAPPAAPSNLTGTRLSRGSGRINWVDNASNETAFEIQRERRSGSSWVGTTNLGPAAANSTSYTDSPGRNRWRYRVRAVNGSGASAWTGWVELDLR